MGLLKPVWWIRVVGISIAVVALLIGALLWRYPNAQIPWREVLIGLLVMPLFMAFAMALDTICPRFVDVSAKRLIISHGQSAIHVRPDQLIEVTIATHAAPAVLRIAYMTQKVLRRPPRPRTVEVAIHPRVDLTQLIGVLTQFRAAAAPPPTDAPAAFLQAAAATPSS